MSKEIAKQKSAEVSTSVDYGSDAGVGFDHTTTDDMVIPMLKVLQALSPEVKSKQGDIGEIWNNVSETGTTELVIVPVYVDHQFVEWRPRKEGGGRVRTYLPTDPQLQQYRALNPNSFPKIFTEREEKGNNIVETFYMYVLILNPDNHDQVDGWGVFPIKSSFISNYKKWNTLVKTFMVDLPDGGRSRTPLFAHKTLFKTFEDRKNDDDFANIHFGPVTGNIKTSLIAPNNPAYVDAKDFMKMIDQGVAKVDFAKEDDAASPSQGGSTKGGEDTKSSF